MEKIFSCLILSLEYKFLTMCLKSYILRKTCGFVQIAQKKLRKTKILFHAQLLQKIFPVLRKLRKKNCAKLIAFHAQKFAKKNLRENSANFAQKI